MPTRSDDLLDVETLDEGEEAGAGQEGRGPLRRDRPIRVSVVSGPDAGRTLVLRDGEALLGTGAECDLRLSDRSVSRRHVRLGCAADGLHVVDEGSRNGTFHGGARVGSLVLRGPARLRLGPHTEIDLAPEEAASSMSYRGDRFGSALGRSPAMRQLFGLLSSVASSDASVLLLGETGTGKEALAESLHLASPRRGGPFVVVDCGTLAKELAGAELFGHVRGSFTGAVENKRGLIEAAHRGTLFLDEIGELPLDLQPHLLRALEKREIRAVGDTRSRQVDIRVIAATHRDLQEWIGVGRFREDLYFRLAVVQARVPPLRERLEDIPPLVEHFLSAMGHPDFQLSEALLLRLMSYEWPGNVRELRNVVQRCVSLRDQPEDLSWPRPAPPSSSSGGWEEEDTAAEEAEWESHRVSSHSGSMMSLPFKEAKAQLVAAFERDYLKQLLERNGGNVSRAAQEAGIDRNHIHRLVKRYGITASRG